MLTVDRNLGRLSRKSSAQARRGFTLSEIIVVLALLGVLGSAIGLTLIRQQRFYRSTGEVLQAREGVRDAMELLSTDIRGMSVSDTVRLAADSAIEFFANIGSSIVCRTSGGNGVGLPGSAPSRGNALTAFLSRPDTGDIGLFLRDSGEWERHRISGFGDSPAAMSCSGSSFAQQNIAPVGKGFLLELSSTLGLEVKPRTPIRFIRRGRYSLYHASDGRWYLGYRRCNALGSSSCGAIQPLSGPYRDYSPDARRTGLLFEYFDESGNRLFPGASPLDIARVDVTARAESRQRIVVEGRATAPGDSATIAVAIRNR